MSGFAAILVGLGVGFLIGLPALVAYRHDIARNFRRLVGSAAEAESDPEQSGVEQDDEIDRLSPGIVTFGIAAGAVTALYGAFSGGIVFIASGIFVMLSTLIAWLATWAVKD